MLSSPYVRLRGNAPLALRCKPPPEAAVRTNVRTELDHQVLICLKVARRRADS